MNKCLGIPHPVLHVHIIITRGENSSQSHVENTQLQSDFIG
ncbi:hypothetical protein [Staphylococcus schleiferi]|nr:hypothetical protein [Staphylococcus schleiferi]